MAIRKPGWDFATELRKAASEYKGDPGTAAGVLAEEPVPLSVFVQDKKYLGNPPLSQTQYDAVRHIERVYYPTMYPLLADEFETGKRQGRLHIAASDAVWREEKYWSQQIRMTNFITLQWGKGSSSPYVRIYNARNGQWVQLKDWNNQDLVGTANKEDGKVFATQGTAAFKEGEGRMYRVRTKKGYETEVWEGHRFLTWKRRRWGTGKPVAQFKEAGGVAWERLWDMQVGDPIAVATVVPEPTEPVRDVPDRDVELIGLWLGNGCMKNGGTLVFGDQSPLARARAAELFEMCDDTWAKSYLDESDGSKRWKVIPKQAGDPARRSVEVQYIAEQYELAGKIAHDKALPEICYSLDNRQVALLVSRLIETDGWVSVMNTGEIGYGTVSKQLATDVQRLMLRLGALAEIKTKKVTYKGEPHYSYQVRVRDRRSLTALAETLTLLDKKEALQRLTGFLLDHAAKKQRAVHGDLAWDRIESIEYIGDDEYWTLSVDGPAAYIGDNGTYHHNSGKDHVCRIASMRVAYLLMCLDSPQVYYGMPEQDTIHLLNVASNSAQAQQAFFQPIVRAVKRGWFADKCIPRTNLVSYAKNIESISGHSDAESQEGLNLMLGIADEIDAFRSKKEMVYRKAASAREPTKSAEGILNMIRTSSSTRFPATFKNVRISYPRYLGSTIQQLTQQARDDIKERGDQSRHFVSGPLATWDVNPRVPGRESFAEDYRDDPILARAKYECRPTLAINPYFRNVPAVDAAFTFVEQEPLTVNYTLERSKSTNRRVWAPQYGFGPSLFPVRGAQYTIHADLATNGDRAGLCMAHVMDWEEIDTTTEDGDGAPYTVHESRPKVKVDFCIAYSADLSLDPPREIQIRWARQLCFDLIRKGFNIRYFSFDSFQCMSGDTKIPLLDGTTKTLRELAGSEPFWVYSIDNGRIVPGRCTKAWKTGFRQDMLEVELDNGEKLRTTGDHRYMLRDGSYRRADALETGDSLMPLYRRLRKVSNSSEDYEQIWHPEADGSGKRWRFTHSMVSHHTYGTMEKGWLTHHVNLNERDNRPENLRQMTITAHSELHREISKGRFEELWKDPTWSAAHRQRISAAQTASQTGKTGSESRRYRHDITFELIAKTHQEMLLEGVKPNRDVIEARLGISQSVLYTRIREAGFRSWKAYRDHIEGVSDWALYQRAWQLQNKLKKAEKNHKVIAVRPAPPEDVYDLQVEDHHNFATDAGVFVHNSTDSMQILEERGIETERVSTNVSDEPWRNLRDLLYEGRLEIPRLSIEGMVAAKAPFLLREELLALSKLPNGRIDHPSGGSKDLADALACAIMAAVKIGGREEEGGGRRYYEPNTFGVGPKADMPFGVTSLKSVWTTSMSPFDF